MSKEESLMRQLVSRVALPCAVLLCAAGPAMLGDENDKKTDITIANPIEVPGAVLQPGTYMFKLVNSSSNRHIVEISSEDGKQVFAVVFTAAARRIERTGKPVMTFYESAGG